MSTPTVTPVASAAAAASPAPSPPPGQEAGQPAALSAPAGSGDDLKRIKGIGPKIEEILHSLGIHYFHQIAGWDAANVEWVNERLRFKGRIEREQWIEQAKELVG